MFIFSSQVMAVVMCAKTILTKTVFQISLTCARRTLPSVKQTSADSKWFLWTPRAPPRLTPTGWSGIRARSWCRLSTAILALLLVRSIQTYILLQVHRHKVVANQFKPSIILIQVTMSSAQWTSVERSSSTRTEMTTTLGLCLATSPAHASTQWCGNRSHRRTGPTHPQELKATLACQSKWSTPPPGLVSIWGTPCGTLETPQDRWEWIHWLRVRDIIQHNVWRFSDFNHCNLSFSGAHSVARPQEHWLERLHCLQMASDPQTQEWTY